MEEVGPRSRPLHDALRKSDAPLDFDFQKVTEQSKDNPVFYVQYAHARAAAIFRQAAEQGVPVPDFASLDPRTLRCLTDEGEHRR